MLPPCLADPDNRERETDRKWALMRDLPTRQAALLLREWALGGAVDPVTVAQMADALGERHKREMEITTE